MYIKALSKRLFIKSLIEKKIDDSNVEEYASSYFISVNEPAEPDEHYFKKEHPNVLTMYFHDSVGGDYYIHGYNEKTLEPIYKPIILFNEDMAKKVVDMIEKAKENNVKSIIVHCTAGISRSGAIATFARDFFGLPLDEFMRENPQIEPNRLVLILLKRELEKRKIS